MQINVNGKPVTITGETIIPCSKRCGSNLWADAETGALSCLNCGPVTKEAPLVCLTPTHPHYEIVWGGLARLVGSLDGWQYLGPNPAYNAHVFRLRETATTRRRVVMVTASGQEVR